MNGKMTAAVLYGKEDVKIEKVPIPHVEEGEVLIKVQVALTCGTDVKVYRRGEKPELISTIATGDLPHGIWASGDGTRVYVGLENQDAVIARL